MNCPRKQQGFTLIELLVVIGIILIASSIIFSIGNTGVGQSLSTSQRVVSGLVQGTRGQAILKSANARLIIHNDPSQMDKYRRYCGIVYKAVDDLGTEGWIATNQGTYLPEGIYFDAQASAAESDWTVGNSMMLEYPKLTLEQEGSGSDYYYYEFKSNGTASLPNAWLVLRAAIMIPGSEEVDQLRVDEELEYLRTALIVRRSGTTTLVEDPASIEDSDGTIK